MKMIRRNYLILQFLCITTSSCDIEFLKAFFTHHKNKVVTFKNCHSLTDNRLLAKEVASGYTQIGFYSKRHKSEFFNSDYIVLDVRNCQSSEQLLRTFNDSKLFIDPVKFLLMINHTDYQHQSETLNNYGILPSSDFIVAEFNEDEVTMTRPYKVGKFQPLKWENYGKWTLSGGLNLYTNNTSLFQNRLDLNGVTLNAIIVLYDNDSIYHLTDFRYPGIDTFTKQDFASMLCVFDFLNVSYTISHVDSYGYYNVDSGEFNGLVHELQHEYADVSACSIYYSEERFNAVDFLTMGTRHGLRFILRKPSTSFVSNIFLITFNKYVWVASVVICVVFVVAIKVVLDWEVQHKKGVKRPDRYTTIDATLIALEAVCQQGTTTEPQSFSGRILTLLFFGAFMFIYVSYSANIVVLLQSTRRINDIEELLKSRMEVGGCRTDYMKNYFESVKKGPLAKLYTEKIYPDKYFELDEGMNKVKEGNFAFHVLLQAAYEFMLENFTNYEICGMQELPGYIEENIGYYVIPKRSPYKDLFNIGLLRVYENGIRTRTNSRILMTPVCYSHSGSFKSVGIYDCEQIFYIWMTIVLVALLVFAIEMMANNWKDRKHVFDRNK